MKVKFHSYELIYNGKWGFAKHSIIPNSPVFSAFMVFIVIMALFEFVVYMVIIVLMVFDVFKVYIIFMNIMVFILITV